MILDCGHEESSHSDLTTGYGEDDAGKRHCYACCAEHDKAQMIQNGHATLYLTDNGVTNWPGSLRFNFGTVRVGRHNIAGKRYDVWFTGPDNATWHGVQYGDMTQICHCKRIKK